MKSLILIIVFLLPICVCGQIPGIERWRDSSARLPDSIRIDSLNEVVRHFMDQSVKDSALKFAHMAYNESKSVAYIHGIAVSLSKQAHMKTFFDGNLSEAEQLDKESIAWYQKTGNKAGLATTLDHVAFVCFGQSKYEEALNYSHSAYEVFHRDQDEAGMLDIIQLIAQIYLKRGEFDKAFNAAQKALQKSMSLTSTRSISECRLGLGTVCMGIEDYSQALTYYRSVFQHLSKEDSLSLVKAEDLLWAKMEYAEIYSHLGRFDSALYRYDLLDTTDLHEKDVRIFLVSKAEYYMLRNQFSKALPNLLRGLEIHKKLNDGNEIVRTILDLAITYHALHNENAALQYAWQGLQQGLASKARQRIRDAYKVLYLVYDLRGVTDSAYFYYQAYIRTKESLTDDQTRGAFAANDYLGRIQLLNQEKLISGQRFKIQDQQLRRESLFRNILLVVVLVVLLIGSLILRNVMLRRRNDKMKGESIRRALIHKSTEMEMRALRAQMNPHFVFNCLNSINSFIMKNESQAASDYLTQFSRLMRMVLNNSKKSWIPLEEEIDMLGLYLDMEKLRFKNAFRYEMVCGKNVDASSLFIPPLLLQPFVENAVWHGLMHKKENGTVSISFTVKDDILLCTVTDNGVGRAEAAHAGSKSLQTHKSMGIQIARERLALINQELDDEKVVFHIEDMMDISGRSSGTRVHLSIRFQQSFNEVEGFHTKN